MSTLLTAAVLLLAPQGEPSPTNASAPVAGTQESGVELPPSVFVEPAPDPSRDIVAPARTEGAKEPLSVSLERLPQPEMPSVGPFVFWTFFVLALLAGLFVLLRRFVQRSKFLGADVIRILARKPLAPRQQVFLVEVGSKVFLVGATKDRLSTLGEIGNPDDVTSLRSMSPAANPDSVGRAFQETLREGLKEAEHEPPERESYDHLVDELKEIRKTVLSWKA